MSAHNLTHDTSQRTRAIIWACLFCFLLIGMPALNLAGIVSDSMLSQWGRYCCFAIAALGVDLVWGYTGMLSLCQAFFFCLGGYAMGMHLILMTGSEGAYGSALPDFMVWNQVTELPFFWKPFYHPALAIILGLTVPAVFAGIFGYLVFRSRVRGVYFAIITQALALAMWLTFNRNEMMLGGTNGLTDFKEIFGFRLSGDPEVVAATGRWLYLATVVILGGAYMLCRKLVNGKMGKVMIAIRDSEHRLRFTGYPIVNYKVFGFVVAATLAGLGGMLYVPQMGIITPSKMSVSASIELIVLVAVGGRSSLLGAVIGALLVKACYSEMTSRIPEAWPFFLGGAFIVIVLFLPNGLVGLLSRQKKGESPA